MKKTWLTIIVLTAFCAIIILDSCKKKDEDNLPAAPSTNAPIHVYSTYFYASWSDIPDANGYKLDVATDNQFTNMVAGYANKEVGRTHVEIDGLTPITEYFFRVRSHNSNGVSGNSGARTVKTSGMDTLPNMNFERWITYVNFENPSPFRVWATANKTVDLNPVLFFPTTVKSTDAHSGTYAAKMFSTDEYPGMDYLITGNVVTGIFSPNLTNPLKSLINGVPYKSRPSVFKGWFKYFPGPGGIDSCEIRMTITRWNGQLGQKDTIGEGIYRTINTVDQYTEFNIPIVYLNQDTPDTLEVIFASSSAGSVFLGQNGSTLYIDDISFVFN